MKSQKRRYSRNEKIFYVLSLILVIVMVLGTIAVVFTPSNLGF
jgi:hypothetical protein